MTSKKTLALAAVCLFTSGLAFAKLPPLTDEQKAKAEETKAIAAAVAKKDAESLAKAQDRVASRYMREQKAKGVTVKPGLVGAVSANDAAEAASIAPAAPELSAAPSEPPSPAKKK